MIDPLSLALITANVGASVFNNWRNNKQSQKLQEKQQEFARAAAERNKQRMWQLMREGQELALEMERESHENRLTDIRNDFDRILHRLAYAQAINTWPLKVLPIVMKNQSLGSLTATADENIAMHCILTPSNCTTFNKHILPIIEDKLADFCNLHWSTLSSHPILFYSGAWKTGTIPTGVEVSQLKTNLSNLPTLLITPFFKPERGIVFQLNTWGIGVELETDIECSDLSYADSYKCGIDYQVEVDIKERTIEEFVPYLQCLIGYIADQYFWTNHNEAPLLPTLLAINVVNTDGMRYLNTASEERYSNLLDVCEKESQAMPFSPNKMLTLLEGCTTIWDNSTRKGKLEKIFINNVQKRSGDRISTMKDALSYELYSKEDLPFVSKFVELYQYNDYKEELSNLIKVLESIDFDYSILESTDIAYLEKLANEDNGAAMFRLGEIYKLGIGIERDLIKSDYYYKSSAKQRFILSLIKIDHSLLTLHKDKVRAMQIQGVEQAFYIESLCDYNLKKYIKIISLADKSIKHPGFLYLLADSMIIENQQIEKALTILSNLSRRGYVEASEKLLQIYKYGAVCQENPKLHFMYSSKAMLQDSALGAYSLALCYLEGYGIEQNTNTALIYLEKAVEMGSEEAIDIYNLLSKYQNYE